MSTPSDTPGAIEVLDPTYGEEPTEFAPATRPPTLEGATVGIISNGKEGTQAFFDSLENALREHHGVAEVERLTKRNYSAPAGAAIMDRAARWHALIAGVGD